MSIASNAITAEVDKILKTAWRIREGRVVPSTESIHLAGGAVAVEATYLYADLADSSGAAQKLYPEVTGKLIRSYLDASSRVIKGCGGEIRSFDGDRVMAIFMGDDKNTKAVQAALGINWAFYNVLRPKFLSTWPTLERYWAPGHGVGIDTGSALIVRGGVRGDNDLVSIGSAPNVAAKFSSLRRKGYSLFVTSAVYANSDVGVRITNGKHMWAKIGSLEVGGKLWDFNGSNWSMEP